MKLTNNIQTAILLRRFDYLETGAIASFSKSVKKLYSWA